MHSQHPRSTAAGRDYGLRDAIADTAADLAVQVEQENRRAREARRHRGSVLIDQRGLALGDLKARPV